MIKRTVIILLVLTTLLMLCGCETREKNQEIYKEGFLDGWESAMDALADSGVMGAAEDAIYYLNNWDREELENSIGGVIYALNEVRQTNPSDYMN